MATSPANPADIQDRTREDPGKPVPSGDQAKEKGGDSDRQAGETAPHAEAGNK